MYNICAGYGYLLFFYLSCFIYRDRLEKKKIVKK